MADERIDIDVSKALADIARLKGGLVDVKNAAVGTGKAIDSAFDEGFALGVVDALNDLEKEYNDLKRAADTLKTALKGATDPTLIKQYAQSIGQLEAGMKRLETTGKAAGVNLKEANKAAGTGSQVFENFFGAFTKATIIIAAIEAVVKFTKYAVGLSEQISTAKKSFEGFTGSAEEAGKIVNTLIATGQKNFIPTEEILKAGKGLLAFGESADNLDAVLTRIADVSAATGKNFNELVTIYGKARTSGVLYAEDINQLVDAGIPIIQEFAKQMGVSESEIKKLASEGKISFEELQLAMFNLTSEGAKFAEQAQNNANTISGAWNKLLADIQPATEKIGGFFKDLALGFVFLAQDAVSGIKGIFKDSVAEIKDLNEQGKDEMYESRREYQKDLDTKDKLEKEAADKRKQASKANAKTAAAEAKRQAKERQAAEREEANLRIQGMKDGIEKEKATENLRYSELKNQLEKYHIDTTEATEQHDKNIAEIELKYTLEKLKSEQELIDLRKQQAAFELAQSEKDFAAQKKNLEELKAIRESEIDITEAQYANLIATLESGGAKKEEIAELQLEFDRQIQAQRLANEIQFQQSLLSITAGGDEAAIALIKNKIAQLQTQLDGLEITPPKGKGGGKGGLLDQLLASLGLSEEDGDAAAEALKKTAENIKSILSDISGAAIDEADRQIEAAEKKTEKAQEAYDKEKALYDEGYANNLQNAERELAAAKAAEDRALEQKKKAQRQQQQIDTAIQLSSLITASAQTFKQFNGALLPIGIALVASMFGAFIASKARAAAASKFKHGGSGRVDGDSIIVGASHDTGGVGIEAEGGEFFGTDGKRFGIVNKNMTAKHFDLLSAINKDDRGKMREALERLTTPNLRRDAVLNAAGVSGGVVVLSGKGADVKAHKLLKEIRDKRGKTITIEGNYVVEREGRYTRRRRVQK
jgi:tape measure domain-containing protein